MMLDTALDLFSDFDKSEVEAVVRGLRRHKEEAGRARAIATRTRTQMRRAKSEAHLAEILPATLDRGVSYHVMSHGDVDALSYLAHIVRAQPLSYVALSTWCMALPDVNQLQAWVDAGQIDRLDLFVGEIFPNQYGEEFARAKEVCALADGRCVVARNHSKVILCADPASDYYAAIESSANVNTNPRIEQTAIHMSRELVEFYRDFFDGLQSIERT